jgi:hypothetical protein
VYVLAVDVVGVEAEAHEHRFYPQNLVEHGDDGDAAAAALGLPSVSGVTTGIAPIGCTVSARGNALLAASDAI